MFLLVEKFYPVSGGGVLSPDAPLGTPPAAGLNLSGGRGAFFSRVMQFGFDDRVRQEESR